MSRIPEETIQQIIAATDIVELIGRAVKLRRAGANWVGLCPFHTERSPSFNVSPHNHSYHCFGCGAGGTVVRFVMENEGLKFPEAIKKLADAAGIRIEEEALDPEVERQMKHRAAMRKAHQQLAERYHELLMKSKLAAPARDYLKSRGINSQIAKNWLLGYAPGADAYTFEWARDHGYSERFLVEAGILKVFSTGRVGAGFRNRLMIPLRSETGEVVAFSARALDPEEKAKYINSPETPIFTKGKMLFGFDKSKRHISKGGRAIVCEGQIDLITAFEAGVQNIVATQGTSLGEAHAKMLRNQAQEVVLCFDADNAGFKAAERAYNILSPVGLVVRVATLPKGEDPDSIIRQKGADYFKGIIDKAVDFLDFQIGHKKSQLGSDLRSQLVLSEQTAATIASNPSAAARDLMIRSHAMQLNLTEDALRKMVQGYLRRQQRIAADKGATSAEPVVRTTAQEAAELIKSQHKTAMTLAQLALAQPDVMVWLRRQDLDPILHDLRGTDLLGLVWHSHHDPDDAAARMAFIAGLPPLEESALTMLINRPMPPGSLETAPADLNALFTARLSDLIQRAQAEMKRPDLSPDRVAELQHSLLDWRKEYLDRTRREPDNR